MAQLNCPRKPHVVQTLIGVRREMQVLRAMLSSFGDVSSPRTRRSFSVNSALKKFASESQDHEQCCLVEFTQRDWFLFALFLAYSLLMGLHSC